MIRISRCCPALLLLLLGLLLPVRASNPANVTEDYLLLNIHRDFAQRMVSVWDNMWLWCGGGSSVDSSSWVDHRTIEVDQNGHIIKVGFTDFGYDPELSSFVYGAPTANVNEQTLAGHDYVYDLRDVAVDGHFTQTDSVELDRERSVSVTHGIVMNASVSSETKISGGYAGIGLEETIKAEFGIQKSSEESRAQSESKSITESHEFSVPLSAGKITRIYLTTGDTRQSREVVMHGVADWTAEFWLSEPCSGDPNWWYKAGQYVLNPNNPQVADCWNTTYPGHWDHDWFSQFETPCKVSIALDEIEAMLTGKHADWQGLVGLWERLYSTTHQNASAALDSRNREVNVHGLERLTFDHEIVEKVELLSADDLDTVLNAGAQLCAATDSSC